MVGNLDWDGLRAPKLYYAVIAVFCGIFLSVQSASICNVALPGMAAQLGITSQDSIWIVNAFQLAIVMLLLPFASMGELWGYRRIYIWGVAVFTAGSLMCAVSASFPMLVVSRVVQGIGAAMNMAVNTSIVKLIYPRRLLGQGIGLNATVVAIASVSGPALSSAILSVASWPWLFAVNIPVGLLTFFMAMKFLPENPVHVPGRKFDWHEAVLNALTFGLFIGCIEAFSHEVPLKYVMTGIALLLVIGSVYVRMETGRRYAMLPFDLLRIPIFTTSVVTSILSFTAQMLVMIGMPFMLTHTFGFDAVGSGLMMTAWPVVIIFVAPLSGWLLNRIHPGILGGLGMCLMVAGCLLLAFVPEDTGHVGIVWRLMLCGAGFGLFQSPNNHLLLTSAPAERTGSASGMLAMARLTGQTTGAALVALMFHLFGDGGSHDAMLLAACVSACAVVCSFLRLKERRV